MLKVPLSEAVDPEGNSPSPFAHLKEDTTSQDKEPIWRTQSLDEGCIRMNSEDDPDENQDGDDSAVTALHSSFDASLLDNHEPDESSTFRPIASAGKRHASNGSNEDPVAPGTVRKLRRRHDLPSGAKNTPARHSHSLRPQTAVKTALGGSTPSSAARRRRSHPRRSPHRHQPPTRIPPTASATPLFKFQDGRKDSPATPRVSLFGMTATQSQVLTPTRANPAFAQAVALKSATKPHSTSDDTGTTVNSSFEGTHEADTLSPTPFRFTSFPASLPRVNNPRTADRNYTCPPSTQKHMTFSTVDDDRKGSALLLSRNSSLEEDGTQNTSLSSLSADAHRENAAASVQPKTREWKSPEDTEMEIDRKNSEDSEGHESRLGAAAASVQSKLFADEDLIASPGGEEMSRTKLDFNQMKSPRKHHRDWNGERDTSDKPHLDLTRPYEQRKTSSFPSTASSTTPRRTFSGFEDGTTDSGTTPSRSGVINIGEHDNPLSPAQVRFHFHVDASQCSPIPGIPEAACGGELTRSGSTTAMDTDGPSLEPRSSSQPTRERPPRSAPRKRPQHLSGGQAGAKKGAPESDDASKLSISNESGDGGSSTSSKMRRLRPMPDMAAFDAGISTRSSSSSRNDRSMDDSSGAMDSRAAPPSPQLVCPPTPQRTPVWAYGEKGAHSKFTRQNSLITTKVLATCPAQVLDGHSSLENSLIDDDDDGSEEPVLYGRRSSFSTVLEEDVEEEERKVSPVRGLTELHKLFAVTAETQPRLTRHSSAPLGGLAPPRLVATSSCVPRVPGYDVHPPKEGVAKTPAPSLRRMSSGSFGEVGSVISFSADFVNLGKLGSGAFADVYKVRSKLDHRLYAVKRNRRHFRGKRDREMAMAEVRTMQRLQSVCAHGGASSADKKEITKNSYSLYLLFFYRAWQEDGHFFCQTELCCRDTCREMKQALGPDWALSQKNYPSLLRHFSALPSTGGVEADGHLIPMNTVWKICHDVAAGLSHIHSHGVVHNDIKSSNIFLVPHARLGAMLKIGDFGMAGDVGTSEDGQEGDTAYMAPELLASAVRHPSADIFSLGLTIYELASDANWTLPSEGSRWQELRNGSHSPDLPHSRSPELSQLIQAMIKPDPQQRPTADDILQQVEKVKEAGNRRDEFLRDYIKDAEEYDRIEEERLAMEQLEANERRTTPRTVGGKAVIRDFGARSPSPTMPLAPALFTPEPAST